MLQFMRSRLELQVKFHQDSGVSVRSRGKRSFSELSQRMVLSSNQYHPQEILTFYRSEI
jgi:hypothetical protein